MEKLRFLKADGQDMAKVTLQFVLSHEAVTTAIPGAENPEQARANAAADEAGALPGEVLEKVHEVTAV